MNWIFWKKYYSKKNKLIKLTGILKNVFLELQKIMIFQNSKPPTQTTSPFASNPFYRIDWYQIIIPFNHHSSLWTPNGPNFGCGCNLMIQINIFHFESFLDLILLISLPLGSIKWYHPVALASGCQGGGKKPPAKASQSNLRTGRHLHIKHIWKTAMKYHSPHMVIPVRENLNIETHPGLYFRKLVGFSHSIKNSKHTYRIVSRLHWRWPSGWAFGAYRNRSTYRSCFLGRPRGVSSEPAKVSARTTRVGRGSTFDGGSGNNHSPPKELFLLGRDAVSVNNYHRQHAVDISDPAHQSQGGCAEGAGPLRGCHQSSSSSCFTSELPGGDAGAVQLSRQEAIRDVRHWVDVVEAGGFGPDLLWPTVTVLK